MQLAARCRTAVSSLYITRHIHSSIPVRIFYERRQVASWGDENELKTFDLQDLVETFTEAKPTNESTAAGHLKMREDRHILRYLRLIELQVPQLVGMLLFMTSVFHLLHVSWIMV